jgi:hypothetical protein
MRFQPYFPQKISFFIIGISSILLLFSSVRADERLIIQLKDFSQIEIKAGGFILPSDARIHIYALGGGTGKKYVFQSSSMYAYGWIINADTRELIWKMDRYNTTKENNYQKFDDQVFLPKGSYEVYYAAYGYASNSALTNFNFNIDRRRDYNNEDQNRNGFLSWLEELFGGEMRTDWKRMAKNWEISLSVDKDTKEIPTFKPTKQFLNIVYKAVPLGETVHIKQRFKVLAATPIRIYALGEKDNQDALADYGWIINMKTHKRVWEMRAGNVNSAGGADKNIKFDEVVNFPAGDYLLYYNTDDSHSYVDWNSAPPIDPFNYGITMTVSDSQKINDFKLMTTSTEEQNVVAQLTKLSDDETRSTSFTLIEETALRIYAIGERSNSYRQLADYGWIINTRTREKVWTMDADRTERAGGADKNRMIDEVITLPKGTYTVFFQTDDSHSYYDWDSSPPADAEHWGITIYGEGDEFNMKNVEKNVADKQPGVIAQIVRVGNNASRTQQFKLDKTARVRIYALGEGQNREMFDYGWIENGSTHNVVWEMTYSMTFNAGGGKKNRSASTTLLLDKGSYILHFVSDDSHSFNHWNTDPPDDPSMWGITIYEDQQQHGD